MSSLEPSPASSASQSGIDIASRRANSPSSASDAVTASVILSATGANKVASCPADTGAPSKWNSSWSSPRSASSAWRSSSARPNASASAIIVG